MKESSAWIWGRHPVLEALRSGAATSVLIASGRRHASILNEIRATALRQEIPVQEVPHSMVEKVAPGQNTQGVVAEVRLLQPQHVTDLIVQGAAAPFLLALDQIQDPHNLGALLRTADAAGVHGIVLPERRSASVRGVALKTSAGAIAHLSIVEVTNFARALDEIRRLGVWTVGLDASAKTTIFAADLTIPLALVIGNEAHGVRQLTRKHCDILVQLPMKGSVSSLNASVAGAIAMYEVLRQRTAAADNRQQIG